MYKKTNKFLLMSEALYKIERYKRGILKEMYDQLTIPQQDIFNRMYVSIDKIESEKIDWAIQQCERTLLNNN